MDFDKLVSEVTRMIMERLQEKNLPKVVQFGHVPEGLIGSACEVCKGTTPADTEGCDYIVMSAESFRQFHGGCKEQQAAEPVCVACEEQAIDLRGKRLVHERDLREQNAKRGDVVRVDKNVIITALAADYAKSIGARFSKEG